jgi:hypothetical protein
MILMNCTHCDDLVVLVDRPRSCICGRSTGSVPVGFAERGAHTAAGDKPIVSGPARLVEIPWEEYDMASGGEWCKWRILRPARRG